MTGGSIVKNRTNTTQEWERSKTCGKHRGESSHRSISWAGKEPISLNPVAGDPTSQWASRPRDDEALEVL